MEHVVLVDTDDNVVGTAEKLAAHEQGLLHRAFSIVLYRNTKHGLQVLLQQRHRDKYHGGTLWSNACCSHPRPNESLEQAVMRRLDEELGLQVPVQQIGHFIYRANLDKNLIEHEFDYIYAGEYNAWPQNANWQEIQGLKWIKLTTLQELLHKKAQLFTPWLAQVTQQFAHYCGK